jgi:uncharacterized protein (TIGR03067 family)
LQALLAGQLGETEQEEMIRHVENCTACQRVLDGLTPASRSWEDVALQLQKESPPPPGLRQVIEQAKATPLPSGGGKALGSEGSAKTEPFEKSTPPCDPSQPEETQAEQRSADRDDDLAFLGPSTRPDAIGRMAHYEVLEVIGKGGFGVVLKAFDEKLHRIVAIKVLSPAYAASGSARKRFIREARAAAAVKNEHVVAIHNVQDEEQPPYLVMELIDGISLQDKLDKHGSLGVKEILRIGTQAAEGLAAAHKQGLVHRDIKPANILLENGVERVKLTDFGLARAVDDASLTQSGTVAGTPMYMSPEQAEGLPIDHRSDLFSLGTVLYAMCTGHPPFRASGTHAVLKRVIDASPRPIREITNEIPQWLCDIIAKLHAKKPEDRFQTAKEVAELLGQHLAHLQQPGSVPAPAPIAAPGRTTPGSAMEKLLEGSDRRKRLIQHGALTVGAALAIPGIMVGALEPSLFLFGIAAVIASVFFFFLAALVKQRWSVDYHGHSVRFENSCMTGETLHIDDVLSARGGIGLPNEVRATIPNGEAAGDEIVVLAESGLVGFDCRIFAERGAVKASATSARLAWTARLQRWLLAAGAVLCFVLLASLGLIGLCRWLSVWLLEGFFIGAMVAGGLALFLGTAALFSRQKTSLRRALSVTADLAFATGLGWVAAGFATPGSGNLLVQCDDPNVRIRIGTGFWGNVEVRAGRVFLPPGDFEVTAERDGKVFFKERMTMLSSSGMSVRIPAAPLAFQPDSGGPGWRPLADGKTYDGWKAFGKPFVTSNVGEGGFVLFPGGAVDTLENLPRDFHLRMWVNLMRGAAGGIRFHAKPRQGQFNQPIPDDGWLVNLSEFAGRAQGQVNLQLMARSGLAFSDRREDNAAAFGEWFYFEIIARGDTAEVRINGKERARVTGGHDAGVLSLWNSDNFADRRDADSRILFRNIEVKDLTPEPGSVQLFAGSDLSRWKVTGKAKATHSGELLLPPSSAVDTNEKLPRNFRLRMDVQLTHGSGTLHFHAPPRDDENDPPRVRDGWYLTFRDIEGRLQGDLVVRDPPKDAVIFPGDSAVSMTGALAKAGEWFHLEILAKDGSTEVRVNGKKTLNVDHASKKPAAGVLSLWNDRRWDPELKGDWTFAFRNIEVKDLTPPEPEFGEWVQPFNGKDLSGWKNHPDQPGDWKVENGNLVGRGRMGLLYSDRGDYGDFDLRVEAKVNKGGYGGIYIRTPEFPPIRMQVFDDPKGHRIILGNLALEPSFHTGSMKTWTPKGHMVQANPTETPADEWFTLDILTRGPEVTVRVNGKKTAQIKKIAESKHEVGSKGFLVLEAAGDDTVIHIRKIEIKEPRPAYKNDKERLQGHWVAVSLDDGEQLPPEQCALFTLTFIGGKLHAFLKSPINETGRIFHLDETTNPKQIDIINEDRRGDFGIYRFEGDRLVLCIGNDDAKDRPTEFSPKGGKGRMVAVFKRAPAPPDGWVQLFNHKDLKGWKYHPEMPGNWKVKDGLLTSGGPASYLFSERGDYSNFHLRVEAKINKDGNSGVFFWSPWDLVTEPGHKKPGGNEAQIGGGGGAPTGSLLRPGKGIGINKGSLNRPDEWFTMEVIAQGDRITIKVNGITTVDHTEKSQVTTKGHIALQQYTPNTVVQFRKIEIKEPPLPAEEPDFVSLFNGKDLTGWVPHMAPNPLPERAWEVFENTLIARGTPDGYIRTVKAYENFILELECQASQPFDLKKGTWAGDLVFQVPVPAPKWDKLSGQQLQIAPGGKGQLHSFNRQDAIKLEPIDFRSFKPGWNRLRVESVDKTLKLFLNGQKLAMVEGYPPTKGYIAILSAGTGMRYRNIKIKELADSKPRMIAGWGAVVNPHSANEVKDMNGRLHVSLPGSLAHLHPKVDLSAPRVLQDVDGNFTIEVQLFAAVHPQEGRPKKKGFSGSGLLAWQDETNFLTFLRGFNEGGAILNFGGFQDAVEREGRLQNVDPNLIHLRLERKGGEFRASYSHDGKAWTYHSGFTNLKLAGKLKVGVVAINNSGVPFRTAFENLRLVREPELGFLPLFNGKNLTGWKTLPEQPGDWKVEGGLLVGRGPKVSHLFSDRGDFEDFHLRFEAKLNADGNSGIFLRTPPRLVYVTKPGNVPGVFEADFHATGRTVTAGTLHFFGPKPALEKISLPVDTWFTQEIIAKGDRIIIKVNGVTVTDYQDQERKYTKGHLALQVYDPATVVHFRAIEIKELSPAK